MPLFFLFLASLLLTGFFASSCSGVHTLDKTSSIDITSSKSENILKKIALSLCCYVEAFIGKPFHRIDSVNDIKRVSFFSSSLYSMLNTLLGLNMPARISR